jgi:hypothetical protein
LDEQPNPDDAARRAAEAAAAEAAEAAADAADARQDEETAEAVVAAVAAAERRRRFLSVPQENVIALGALILSLVIALINVYYAVRGPEVVVQPADQVILYRDGEGEHAILTVAVPVMMINAASAEHGDVMVEATLEPGRGGGRYPYQTLVQPIFTQDTAGAKQKCEVGTRCIVFDDLVLVERTDEIIDIPGGSAKSRYLSFQVTPPACKGPRAVCDRYRDFNAAVAALQGKALALTVKLQFHSDGTRTLTCPLGRMDLSYLTDHGWTALPCEAGKVTGDRFL